VALLPGIVATQTQHCIICVLLSYVCHCQQYRYDVVNMEANRRFYLHYCGVTTCVVLPSVATCVVLCCPQLLRVLCCAALSYYMCCAALSCMNVLRPSCEVQDISVSFQPYLNFPGRFLQKAPSIKYHETLSSRSKVNAFGRT
jgi:hypothetical protein